jgi:hypothetical protein
MDASAASDLGLDLCMAIEPSEGFLHQAEAYLEDRRRRLVKDRREVWRREA